MVVRIVCEFLFGCYDRCRGLPGSSKVKVFQAVIGIGYGAHQCVNTRHFMGKVETCEGNHIAVISRIAVTPCMGLIGQQGQLPANTEQAQRFQQRHRSSVQSGLVAFFGGHLQQRA